MKYLLLRLGYLFLLLYMHNLVFMLKVEVIILHVRATRSQGIENGKGGFGWQAGFGTEYHTQYGYFLYLGIDLAEPNI